jgi:hypothetical protein
MPLALALRPTSLRGRGLVLPAPAYDLDFAGSSTASDLAAAGFSFSRSGIALALDGTMFTADVPRLGSSGLLIEVSRTNSFVYSNDLASASWVRVGVTPTTTAGTAPGGAYSSTVLVESASNELHHAYQGFTYAASTAYTCSAFVKAVSGTRWARLTLPVGAFGTALSANFDLATGAITVTGGSPTCTATSIGDGWWRISIAATTTTGGLASASVGMAASASGTNTYAGDNSSSIRVAFAQLEAGAFPSSPIPTSGSAVTRSAENCIATRSAAAMLQGTVVADVITPPAGTTSIHYGWSASDGTISNRVGLGLNSAGICFAVVTDGGVSQGTPGASGVPFGSIQRAAMRWRTNDFGVSVGGAVPVLDTLATIPAGLTQERVGSGADGGAQWYGTIRRVRLWSQALDDATLRSLST